MYKTALWGNLPAQNMMMWKRARLEAWIGSRISVCKKHILYWNVTGDKVIVCKFSPQGIKKKREGENVKVFQQIVDTVGCPLFQASNSSFNALTHEKRHW